MFWSSRVYDLKLVDFLIDQNMLPTRLSKEAIALAASAIPMR
jgi:hypothetical protein